MKSLYGSQPGGMAGMQIPYTYHYHATNMWYRIFFGCITPVLYLLMRVIINSSGGHVGHAKGSAMRWWVERDAVSGLDMTSFVASR